MSATNGSSLVRIGISPVGRGTFKYADLISAVHHMQSSVTAICIINARVGGLTVGLKVCGIGNSSRSIFAASWSPRAAPRALCLSGRPLLFFLRLHFIILVPICQYFFIALTFSVETGTSVPVSFVRSHTSLRIASLNCFASGALSASRVDVLIVPIIIGYG
jgi:hypothetical protein